MNHFPSTNNVVILALLLLIFITTVKGDPDTTRVGGECGSETWVIGDPYGTLVENMLNELPVECAKEPNHKKNVEYEYEGIMAYGRATCSENLSEEECKACLAVAQERLLTDCPLCKSAWVQLVDCYMGYSNTP